MDVIVQTNNKVDARCTPGRGEVRTGGVERAAVCRMRRGGRTQRVSRTRHGEGGRGGKARWVRYLWAKPEAGKVCRTNSLRR